MPKKGLDGRAVNDRAGGASGVGEVAESVGRSVGEVTQRPEKQGLLGGNGI